MINGEVNNKMSFEAHDRHIYELFNRSQYFIPRNQRHGKRQRTCQKHRTCRRNDCNLFYCHNSPSLCFRSESIFYFCIIKNAASFSGNVASSLISGTLSGKSFPRRISFSSRRIVICFVSLSQCISAPIRFVKSRSL